MRVVAATCSVILLGHATGALAAPLVQELRETAQRATVRGQLDRATGLLRGAWELSRNVTDLRELAKTMSMNGQFEEAIEAYKRVLAMKPGAEIAREARDEVRRLEAAPAPFKDRLPHKFRATGPARRAFRQGMKQIRHKNKREEAVRFLRAALVLDPELPGPYRVLGALYGKLGDPKKERAFLTDYLRIRPDGRIADTVRKRLKDSGILAGVTLKASFPCQIWINGRPLGKVTPLKGLHLPSGSYTISFVNAQYHIIRNKRVTLRTGEKTTVSFAFGVLDVKLEPWARVRASGRDLGLWSAVGLPVGEYNLSLEAHDNSRQKKVRVLIEAGKTTKVTRW